MGFFDTDADDRIVEHWDVSRATWDDAEHAQADLFRVADGLVVEHGDAAEPVPPPEELVNSGKF